MKTYMSYINRTLLTLILIYLVYLNNEIYINYELSYNIVVSISNIIGSYLLLYSP
jgi:hypothetical protein